MSRAAPTGRLGSRALADNQAVAPLVILASLGLATAIIGRAKGSSFFIWFLVGFVLPVIGVVAVILYRSELDEPERKCPQCGSVQKIYVQVCTVCGEDLFLPDVAEVRKPGALRAR
jgi:hypothetical protein